MNIAFPAFFILALIIPGFIFLNSYEKVENTTIEKKPFDVSSSLAFFYALMLHAFLITVMTLLTDTVVNYEICLKLLTGTKTLPAADLAIVKDSALPIFLYFASAYLLSFIFGKLVQKVIFALNPYKSSKYAFDTPWYYELKGKLSETQNAQLIKISCLVDSNDGAFLYYGVLEDFYLDSSGKLNRLVLSGAMRRALNQDESSEPDTSARFYEIKGDRLILKYEDVKNVNIEYLYITEA
jgi:hypothetical protein